ncbi:peptidylprolyl isomerase [Candidatus Woesearchaeota archaeon]|nr:peptidylprolyl isomerase [Candidatus Woesearchaeota archaeon]
MQYKNLISVILLFSFLLSACQAQSDVMKVRAVKLGDTVTIDYAAGYTNGTLFDTTFEDVAKKAGIYRENEEYGPRKIVVGKDEIIKGVEEALIGMKEGEANTVTIPPEKAYGSYDAGGIRFLQKSTFEGLSENVKPGDTISIKTASSIVPARVLNTTEQGLIIDLNHPLAGKPVVFAIILRKIESTPNASTPNAGPT